MPLQDHLDGPLPSHLNCIDTKINNFIDNQYDIFELCKEVCNIMIDHNINHRMIESEFRDEVCNDLKEDIVMTIVEIIFYSIGEHIENFFANLNEIDLNETLSKASDWFKTLEDDDKIFIRDGMLYPIFNEKISGIDLLYQTISVFILDF